MQQRFLPFMYRSALTTATGVLAGGLAFFGLIDQLHPKDRSLVDPKLTGEAMVKAMQSLSAGQRQTLIQRESAQLKSEPLDQSALNNLSILEGLEGNAAKSEEYSIESASRTLRDSQSQISVFERFLERKDYAKAMYHLDGVLVSEPDLRNQLFQHVAPQLENGAVAEQLAAVLNRNPIWRVDFFTWLNTSDKTGQLAFKVFNLMRKSGGSPTSDEIQAYLKTLIDRGDIERAYFVWLDSLDESALREVGNIYDGAFRLEPKNHYFDWTIYPFANSRIGVISKQEDANDRMLRLSFHNSISMFGHVFQYLHLQPGRYTLAGEEAARNFQVPGGLRFVVSCAADRSVLGVSTEFRDTGPWRDFSFDFNVPDRGCGLQVLRLQSASSAVLDAKLDGDIYFDNIKVERARSGSEQAN